MGMDLSIYAGCYLRVWKQKVTVLETGWCFDCDKRYFTGDFCRNCGAAYVSKNVEHLESVYEILEDICNALFGFSDHFMICHNEDGTDGKPYDIVFLNDGKGAINEYETEHSIPLQNWGKDWEVLTSELEKRNIKIERKYGIVTSWS